MKAVQWNGKNEREVFDFLTNTKNKQITTEESTFRIDLVNGGCRVGNLMLKTSKGEVQVYINGWIIKEANCESKSCENHIFLEKYEFLDEYDTVELKRG